MTNIRYNATEKKVFDYYDLEAGSKKLNWRTNFKNYLKK